VALARTLREKRIPFLVLTGHYSDPSYDDVFLGAPWLVKPMSHDSFINTVRTLMLPVEEGPAHFFESAQRREAQCRP
jgi:hypothetical protein